MNGLSIGLLTTRALALLSAIIVLGLSAHLVKEVSDYNHYACRYSYYCLKNLETALDYATFVGVWGIVDGAVGLTQFFLDANLVGVVALAVDGLSSIFFLAGGINLAVVWGNLTDNQCNSGNQICDETEADIAFMFIAFAATLAAAVLVFVTRRRST